MTIFFLLALVAEFSSGQATPINDIGGTANPDVSGLVKLGQFAPDFELPKLTFKTDDTGKPIGVISEKDTVRLSSFRGKKPVCLIMSSYT
jgi:CBS domain-containing protein